jgi:hypothetical protein
MMPIDVTRRWCGGVYDAIPSDCGLAGVGMYANRVCSRIRQTEADIAIRREDHSGEKAKTFSGWIADVKRSRARLSDLGITGTLVVTNDFSDDLRGGAQPDSDFDRCLLDVSFAFDGHKLAGWSGGSALVRLHSYAGENGRDYVGDAQGFSNIDDDSNSEASWLHMLTSPRQSRTASIWSTN